MGIFKGKVILIFTCVFMFVKICSGQSKGITPMHKFFQQNADSTIIMEYDTQSYDPNYYKILTKTGDTVNTFSYNAIQKLEAVLIPRKLKFLLFLEKYKDVSAPANINSYFNLVNLPKDTVSVFWQKISLANAWKIIQDNSYPKCQPRKEVPVVMDEGGIIIHLITKAQINTLFFQNPWSYEQSCPGNRNRIGAVEIDRLFRFYFHLKK